MARVYLSLGSNLGDRLDVLRAAVRRLRESGEIAVVDASPLYESEPWEESALGRVRPPGTPEARRYAPRTVDIDILFYDDDVIAGPDDLHVPHLLLAERAFVLRPLADVAPDLEHPTLYVTVRELLAELTDEHAVRAGAYPVRWFED